MKTQITIVSDIICPWCWIGKRQLEKAIELSGRNINDFDIEWSPFMLAPDIPIEGKPKSDTDVRVGAHLKSAGAGVGVDFTGKTDRTPNTLMAHTVLCYAKEAETQNPSLVGLQHRLQEVLFQKYFSASDGTSGNVGDSTVLKKAVEQVGLNATDALAYAEDKKNQSQVFKKAQDNRLAGVNGVPSFFFNGTFAFSGALPPENFIPYLTANQI